MTASLCHLSVEDIQDLKKEVAAVRGPGTDQNGNFICGVDRRKRCD